MCEHVGLNWCVYLIEAGVYKYVNMDFVVSI